MGPLGTGCYRRRVNVRSIKKRAYLWLASVLAMAATGLTAASQCAAERASLIDKAGNCITAGAATGCIKVAP